MNPIPPIPVTIVTGFLGSGKTTLLNRILDEPHGGRIAVIENEFGEVGVDNDLLVRDGDEQIVEMNNGCICCTVRGDLVRILAELHGKRAAGTLRFDRVIIETTGLADPAPVAQTFFVDEAIAARYRLDAIVTLVDAVHAPGQLDAHHEAQEQVGFADRILLSKTDLVADDDVRSLEQRLRRMNPRAPIRPVHFGSTPIDELLDIRGFDLDTILGIEPDFLTDVSHEHDDDVSSLVFESGRAFDGDRLSDFFHALLRLYGPQLMRYKGIVQIAGIPQQVVIQGVHMLMSNDYGRTWKRDQPRTSRMVFIGKDLPRELLMGGLADCLVPPKE